MTDDAQEKPKIIIDDDWKTRVQAEKEALQQQADNPEPEKADKTDAELPLPPPSFTMLITSLATQAIGSLGQIPDADGKPVVQLDHAKHAIDMLGILEEKTKGNLSSDEAAMMDSVLHELRMAYVAVSNNPPPPSESAS